MPTRFGMQPARQVLVEKDMSIQYLIELMGGDTPSHVKNAIYGIVPPSMVLRRKLPVLLETSLEKLFTPEALAARMQPHPKRKKNETSPK